MGAEGGEYGYNFLRNLMKSTDSKLSGVEAIARFLKRNRVTQICDALSLLETLGMEKEAEFLALTCYAKATPATPYAS